MTELVEYLVGALVPEGEFSVELREGGDESEIVVIVSPGEIGKVIGKQGKIARAIRYNVVIEERADASEQ